MTTLRDLDAAATGGEWRKDERYIVAGAGRTGFRPSGEVIAEASPSIGRFDAYPVAERIANAEFIVAVVNAFRAGELVPVPSRDALIAAIAKGDQRASQHDGAIGLYTAQADAVLALLRETP